jgi:hypothetical protein
MLLAIFFIFLVVIGTLYSERFFRKNELRVILKYFEERSFPVVIDAKSCAGLIDSIDNALFFNRGKSIELSEFYAEIHADFRVSSKFFVGYIDSSSFGFGVYSTFASNKFKRLEITSNFMPGEKVQNISLGIMSDILRCYLIRGSDGVDFLRKEEKESLVEFLEGVKPSYFEFFENGFFAFKEFGRDRNIESAISRILKSNEFILKALSDK